ncbi:uncharacterized protein LOC106879754 [Octopus bimaculoides]|uniref:uncharacterized protein LOC106879754 n=1 Tax=Octopus bimaculoides TaxID=37653 RepID=UPI00071CBEDE|nr:uncharacterized protein LOC106879754 [Octopus bimaculoides]|eukprot:XP_014784919.1 PREDICTED: uncharacterized protein LOC106879754 [Octopus bimaculoides]
MWICPSVIPESQCGFRSSRGTMDMIFSARQLQDKCIEHRIALYQVFVDLTKSFYTVNRTFLWTILGKLGCPPQFVNLSKQLHSDMKARLNFNRSLSEPISIENGVKQGDIAAPTLFPIYFATWTTYQRHIKALERFHQTCLRRILDIKWKSLTLDTVVLQQANTPSIEMILIRSQMRLVGHLARMQDDRLPKQLFYGELQRGKRPRHNPKKRFRDAVESNLKALNVKVEDWEQMTQDRSVWKQMIYNRCKAFEA